MNTQKIQPRVSFSQKFGLFICAWILMTIIGSTIIGLIQYKFGGDSTPALRISTIIQDVFIFIVPAIVTAVFITRTPASFLCIDRFVSVKKIVLTLLTLTLAIPIMNFIIEWNANIHLPDSLSSIEQWMKNQEIAAANSVTILLGKSDIPNLIMSILIVGIFAGLSEELFFRGALQRIFQSKPMNIHVAIWCTAIIFSAVHMQFYGFIPRMLLGAFFGYLLWWSKSLWLPIIAHIYNNTLTVIFTWLNNRGAVTIDANSIGATTSYQDIIIAIISLIVTIISIYYLRKVLTKNINQTSCGGTQSLDQGTSL